MRHPCAIVYPEPKKVPEFFGERKRRKGRAKKKKAINGISFYNNITVASKKIGSGINKASYASPTTV